MQGTITAVKETADHQDADQAVGPREIEMLITGNERKGLTAGRGLAVIAVGVVLLFFVMRWNAAGESSVVYLTEPVSATDLTVTVTATGTVEPRKEVSVGIEVSGTIEEVFADFNDRVAAGQDLARLDTAILEAQLAQTRASLALAQANEAEHEAALRQNEMELQKLLALREASGGVLPAERDLDNAVAARDRASASLGSAKAQVRQSEAQLVAKETELGKARIVSPIDGIVLARKVDPGQTVAAAFQTPELFLIAEDLAEMQLRIDIDEADIGQVREGQQASFSVDAYPDEAFPAEIRTLRYAPNLSAGVVTYEAILSVDNATLRLRPGMTATATVIVEEVADAVVVPNAALRFAPAIDNAEESGSIVTALIPRPPGASLSMPVQDNSRQRTVWILDASGQPKPVEILVGATDGARTEVVGGDLAPAARVIVEQQDAS